MSDKPVAGLADKAVTAFPGHNRGFYQQHPYFSFVIDRIAANRAIFGFDVDGTLVDSEPVLHANFEATAREHGYTQPFNWDYLNGRGDLYCMSWMSEQQPGFKIHDPDKFLADYLAKNLAMGAYEAKPGMVQLFTTLRQAGFPVGIYTSALRNLAQHTLTTSGYDISDVPLLSGHDHPDRKKPDPHGYILLANQLAPFQQGVDHSMAPVMRIAFEDTKTGCFSAYRAGYAVFHLLEPGAEPMQCYELQEFGDGFYFAVTPDIAPDVLSKISQAATKAALAYNPDGQRYTALG